MQRTESMFELYSYAPLLNPLLTLLGQQIPCRYAGGALADQGFGDLRTTADELGRLRP
jgi:hypothetical protein